MSNEIIENINYGWKCPCCTRVFSPTTKMCIFCIPQTDVKFKIKNYRPDGSQIPHHGQTYIGNTTIDVLQLDVRTLNCLKCAEIFEVEQFQFWTEFELAMIPNLGRKSLTKLLLALKEVGITLEKYPSQSEK